jgi:hypothetical protein
LAVSSSLGEIHGFEEFVRPHRKDGYVDRTRIHLRVDDRIVVGLDQMAAGLGLSRSHVCDLVLRIAVEDGGSWLCGEIRKRIKKSLAPAKISSQLMLLKEGRQV